MENKNEDTNFAKKKLDELREKIKQYGYSYHVTNSPEVSDTEYDDLVQQLRYYEVLCDKQSLENKVIIKSTMTSQENKEVVDKALNLFQYLNYFVRLRTSIVQNIDQYSSYIWFSEIPYNKLCFCVARELDKEESDSTWVEIKRPTLPKVPPIPPICDNWVNLDTLENYEHEPTIKDKIVDDQALKDGADKAAYLELVNYPEIQSAWSEYLKQKWGPWAESYGELRKVYNIYAKLFSMYQQQKALGEAYEVVLCLGLLDYKTKEGASIYRHILTAQIELIFEPVRGTISVKSNAEGVNLQFETEMLGVNDQPEVEIQRKLEDIAMDIGSDIWHKSKIHPLILSWVNSFNSKAVYNESLDPPQRLCSHDNPEVTFAPAIILRERTKVGTLKFIGKVIEDLKGGGIKNIPQSIRTFLTTDDDSELSHSVGDGISEGECSAELKQENIYFPLYYNDEQLRIVRYINGRKGIVVQGPPGTGKSHTIANLVCHLLAEGKRVLITSQAPRALKVLKDKIPKQIQSLCVSILGQNQIDFDNLMGAVHEITNMNNVWDKKRSNDSIIKLEAKLFDLRKKFQNVKVLMTELREKETYKHSIVDSKYKGTAQEIASRLKTEENRYGWIPDSIGTNESQPLSIEEFKKLVELNRALTKERTRDLLLKRIHANEIFSPEEFVEIVENEQIYKAREREIENDINLRILYNKLKQTNQDKRARLLVGLRLLEKTKEEACRRPLPWLKSAVYEMLGDQDQPLKLLFVETQEYLNGLKEISVNLDKHDFLIPEQVKLHKIKVDVEDLLFHLKNGKNLGWWVFRPQIYKRVMYLLKDTLVDGRACCNNDCLNLLLDYVNARIKLGKLEELWKSKISIPEGSLASKFGIYFEQLEALEVVILIEKILLSVKEAALELQVISEPVWHDSGEVEKLLSVLEATLIIDKMRPIEEKIGKIQLKLKTLSTSNDSHPLNSELLNILDKRDWTQWNKAYEKISVLEKSHKELELLNELLGRLRGIAPSLTSLICDNPNDDVINECSDDFEKAWDLARADAWLRDFEESHDEYQLQRDYEDIDKKIRNNIAELAAQKAWHHCLSRMTGKQRQSLIAWSLAIKKIGKGTGKHAEKYRREAEEYMADCRTAIPAWIMPIYRVVESFKPTPELFDVLIVDEASQSGPEALALFYIAKKCVIVGDNQQISPVNVGADPLEVDALIERFLKDIPLRKTYGLQGSLFDHAMIRFNKSHVFLREHFRCVPEIIQFSNNLCYTPLGASLIPLRSYSPNRLDPVKAIRIIDGFKEGDGQYVVNKPEAIALVKQIAKCCDDNEYKGKSMGVIVLQGHAQDQLIKKLLIEEIGVDEIERRNLICGDPYAFQGDERDVMFLSLVAGSNDRIGALAKEADKRRFNVAFSRARDQVWLFHSVTINDLSPGDLRYSLLSYCQNPLMESAKIEGVNIDDLKGSMRSGRSSVPTPFDSWFEADVFVQISDHGYRVIPQFKVAEFKIDLVIEGLKNRLAIECDGDEWHGIEEYEKDQWRQRILERAGWRFWRIRGSMFYRDREQALESLWQVLEELGINSSMRPEQEADTKEEVILSEVVDKPNQELFPEIKETNKEVVEEDRLSAALNYSKNNAVERYAERYKETKDVIIEILQEGSQDKDLVVEKVLKKMGISNRNRNPDKFRRRVSRAITDLKRLGKIEKYDTDKGVRVRFIGK